MNLDDLLDRLDLETKVRLLTGATFFTLHGEPAIGLAPMALSDGPTGVRGLQFAGGRTTSLLPNATLLAAAWSTETAHEVGVLLAEEAQRQQIHVVLGPTINLHRPLGGRLFEAYSEDPLLTGLLAAAYVRGLQEHASAPASSTWSPTRRRPTGTRSTAPWTNAPCGRSTSCRSRSRSPTPTRGRSWPRTTTSTACPPPSRATSTTASSRASGDGTACSCRTGSPPVRGPAANGGLDLVMPGPEGPWGQALVDAVKAGAVAPSVLDDHVRRLLRLADRVGALGEPRTWPTDLPEPDDAVRRDQLLRLAASGMTVLTNDGTLPLAHDTEIALIGRHALETTCMGGGSAQVRAPTRSASPTASASGSATTSRSSTAWRSARDPAPRRRRRSPTRSPARRGCGSGCTPRTAR